MEEIIRNNILNPDTANQIYVDLNNTFRTNNYGYRRTHT